MIGLETGVARVPIVPAAAIFARAVGAAVVCPDARAGYRGCLARERGPLAQGNVGAGTGATVGKLFNPTHVTKGGLGAYAL